MSHQSQGSRLECCMYTTIGIARASKGSFVGGESAALRNVMHFLGEGGRLV